MQYARVYTYGIYAFTFFFVSCLTSSLHSALTDTNTDVMLTDI